MKQALYEMRRIHSPRSESKEMPTNTTCRLSGQEEEILRSELRKIIREERGQSTRQGAETTMEPTTHTGISAHSTPEQVAQTALPGEMTYETCRASPLGKATEKRPMQNVGDH